MNAPLAQLRKAPQPLTSDWTHERLRLSAVCEAPGGESLSLIDFYSRDSGSTPLGHRMARIFGRHVSPGLVYAPTVTAMNAERIDPYDMPLVIRLPNGTQVMRNRDKPADMVAFHHGMIRKRTRTFLMSGGGCGIGVATGGGHAAIAHLSKDGLIDPGRVALIDPGNKEDPFADMRPSRKFESNVHAMAWQFRKWHVPLKEVQIRTLFFIPPKMLTYPLNDPVYREKNQKLHLDLQTRFGDGVIDPDTGALAMVPLTKRLAHDVGFDPNNVRNECYLPAAGQFAHTRNPDEFLSEARNLAWVTVSCS